LEVRDVTTLAPTRIRVFFRAPPPANPARIPINASVDRYRVIIVLPSSFAPEGLGVTVPYGIAPLKVRGPAAASLHARTA
jgi:hypothetical protein